MLIVFEWGLKPHLLEIATSWEMPRVLSISRYGEVTWHLTEKSKLTRWIPYPLKNSLIFSDLKKNRKYFLNSDNLYAINLIKKIPIYVTKKV